MSRDPKTCAELGSFEAGFIDLAQHPPFATRYTGERYPIPQISLVHICHLLLIYTYKFNKSPYRGFYELGSPESPGAGARRCTSPWSSSLGRQGSGAPGPWAHRSHSRNYGCSMVGPLSKKDGHSILYGPWMLHARAFLKGMNIAF